MNFRNLIGIYQFAIARCIDVIGFDNDITRNADGTHEEVWDIISAVSTLMIDNGNVDVIEEMDFSEEKLETARRFQNLLYEMENLDKRIADIEKENQEGSMEEKVLESVSSGKATVNEAGNKSVLYFCDHRKNKECKKNSCYSKGTVDCFFTSKSEYRATGILRLFLKIVTWKERKALKNRINYK